MRQISQLDSTKIYVDIYEPDLVRVINRQNISTKKKKEEKKNCDKIATTECYRRVLLQTLG